ncbi:MAG: hypothetical protein K1X53_08880 [Candidatus Sumerlaeaceae bacterium]|nr:hypothetical protein [Candidatus Sumerlaeaceae bacterium]
MNRFAQLAALTAAFVVFAGASEAKKPSKPKPGQAATTYTLGRIEVSDSRILDVSGSYTLSSSTSTVELDIVQDSRGKLLSTATLTLGDQPTTGPIQLNGELKVKSNGVLSLSLKGGEDDDDSSDDSSSVSKSRGGHDDPSGDDHGDKGDDDTTDTEDESDDSTGVHVEIKGDYDGAAFNVTVDARVPGASDSFAAVLTPVNTARGAVVEDAAWTASGQNIKKSTRNVTIPTGLQSLPAQQKTTGNSIQFNVNNGNDSGRKQSNNGKRFSLGVQGTATDGAFTLKSSVINPGYGQMDVTASTVVSPSAF